MTVKKLTSKDFDEFIKSGKAIIDFYADWCNPCKISSPIIEELSNEIKDVKFGKVDVDKESELARRFYIMSIPTLLFFKNKERIDRVTGAIPKDELIEKIKEIKL